MAKVNLHMLACVFHYLNNMPHDTIKRVCTRHTAQRSTYKEYAQDTQCNDRDINVCGQTFLSKYLCPRWSGILHQLFSKFVNTCIPKV